MTLRDRLRGWLDPPREPVPDEETCPRCGGEKEREQVFCVACWGCIQSGGYEDSW